MNTEVLPIRTGVLIDSFDPVRSGHLDACRTALSGGAADRVFLVMTGDPFSGLAPAEDRWRMLCAACAGSKKLVPLRLPPKYDSSGAQDILCCLLTLRVRCFRLSGNTAA